MEIVNTRIEHILKKNHDYGDAWQENGPFTPLMRIKEKLIRVETLSNGKQALVLDEKVEDNIGEVFDYALLWLLWKSGQPPRQLSFLEWLRKSIEEEEDISQPLIEQFDFRGFWSPKEDLNRESIIGDLHIIDFDDDDDGFPF
jgi:hypothetical protein